MTSERVDQERQRFADDVIRLAAKTHFSNAEIGRLLNVHRNAVFYWRNRRHTPSAFLVRVMRSRLDELLEEHDLTPAPN